MVKHFARFFDNLLLPFPIPRSPLFFFHALERV